MRMRSGSDVLTESDRDMDTLVEWGAGRYNQQALDRFSGEGGFVKTNTHADDDDACSWVPEAVSF